MQNPHSPIGNVLTRRSPPAFSVIIPAYNAICYVPDALESVFGQTFKDYEVILINDGSPHTKTLENELDKYRNRITYLTQKNKGPGGARNTGIMHAQADYIAFLDSDDEWLPTHLAEMFTALKHDPTLDLIYADAINFGVSNSGRRHMETNPSEGVADFKSLVEQRCSVIASSVVARRQKIIDAGLFDESFRYGEDFDLWLRLAYSGGRIDYLRKVHVRRRLHDRNLTADAISSFEGQARVLEKLVRQLSLASSLKRAIKVEIARCRASMALEQAKRRLVERQYARAWEEIQRANGFFRRPKLQLVLLLLRTAPELVRHFYLKRYSQLGNG